MANKIELTADQSANLDLVISNKLNNNGFFIEVAEVCTPTLVMHIENVPEIIVCAITGQHNIQSMDASKLLEIGKTTSLNDLLEIRNNSIIKK